MRSIKELFDKRLLSNMLGNVLEWYDFTLYGTLAPVIAQLFFPAKTRWYHSLWHLAHSLQDF